MEFQIFTPLSRNGKKRLRYDVKPYTFPRGKVGRRFIVEKVGGGQITAKIVACSLGSGCACDAQIVKETK